ncbi:MAG: ATP-binding cassette domain-containing protein [Actinomycetota bacterium]|nr:ATP-binding cassette domain-containing protein [Actinomycetota bacterium]
MSEPLTTGASAPTAGPRPALEVRGLTVRNVPSPIVDVDLDVHTGETVALIGANGAGKSTVLRAIGGLVEAEGVVVWHGTDLRPVPGHERAALGIAMVPEGRRVFASLTVEENLRMGAGVGRRGPWDLDAVYELFPLLERARRRRAGAMSAAEQQAIAVGRALMANPDLLVMDEVSLGLAPVVVAQLYDTLAPVFASGATILLVGQDVGRVLDLADRVYCLLEGRVSLAGRPIELGRDDIRAAYFGTGVS